MNYKIETSLTDQRLVERVLQGDTIAFEQIIRNTEGVVAQIVFKMVENDEDRKDIAQEIYLKAFKNLSHFKFQSKLSTWISKISYNNCLNFLEKKKLVLLDNINEVKECDDDALEEKAMTTNLSNMTEAAILQKELSNILQSEITKLPPVYKTLITLFHNEDLSYAEIAEITELPEGTVKNYLFRARKALKENLLVNYKKEDL